MVLAGALVVTGGRVAMDIVWMSKMILTTVVLVLRSVLEKQNAPLQCVIMVADWIYILNFYWTKLCFFFLLFIIAPLCWSLFFLVTHGVPGQLTHTSD